MIGEVLKGTRRVPLFALKQHRNKWRGHQDCRGDLELIDRHEMPKPLAHRAIANLIVILQKRDESMRRKSHHWRAVPATATLRICAVVREAAGESFSELRDQAEISHVAGMLSGQDSM